MKQGGEKQHGGSHAVIEKIITGIPGLDQILQGGIPRFSTLLIAGKPGTGKTILTQNILFNNAGDQKVLYIATLSEPQIKVLRYQEQFAFFDSSKVMGSVIFRDLGSTIRQKGVLEALSATKHGTSYLADNIIYLFYAQEGHELKRFIGVLKMRGTTHDKVIKELIIGKAGPEVRPTSSGLTAGFNLKVSERQSFLEKDKL